MIFDVNAITMLMLLNVKGRYFDVVLQDYLKILQILSNRKDINSTYQSILDGKMFIYRYVVIILTFACMNFVHGGPIRSLTDEINRDQTKRVETIKGKF